ncbi:unnamed protein product [Ceratitis capitata]|uniref:(Mediterranean fruit fly) hypothetical protein n=1 Tax=Ceratitis capitata TaxID=7213 RepID=A0A811V022_CERCA|nr:unnamed protein product [Ceratitis capitata]
MSLCAENFKAKASRRVTSIDARQSALTESRLLEVRPSRARAPSNAQQKAHDHCVSSRAGARDFGADAEGAGGECLVVGGTWQSAALAWQ